MQMLGTFMVLFLQPLMIHVDISITWQHFIAGTIWVFEDKKYTQASEEEDKTGDPGSKD